MRYESLARLVALTSALSMAAGVPAGAAERTTPFCKILSMESDLHWTYFTLPSSCFKEGRFQIRSDANQNINVLAHLFAAHAGGLEVSIVWDVHGFGPTVLGVKTRPPG